MLPPKLASSLSHAGRPLGGLLLVGMICGLGFAQSGPLLWQGDGAAAFQAFGGKLAGLADIDGDGVRDLVAGCQEYGQTSGMVRAYSGATGAVIHTWSGFQSGSGVADAGDVDGDGTTDVVVGDIWADVNFINEGEVWVFSGSNGSLLRHFVGGGKDRYLGGDVGGLGDLNGDGYSEVILGAWGESTTVAFAGVVYVRSGIDGSVLYRIEGGVDHGYFGYSVARVEDTDGDGITDFAVGAPGESSLGHDTGAAYLYSGANGALLRSWNGLEINSRFGRQLRGVGDADGDGRGDIVVGAMLSSPNGKVHLLSGASGAILHSFVGYDPEEVFGHSVDSAGDVDGDGFDDILVGSDHFASLFSGYTGVGYLYSGKTGVKLQYLQEGSPTARFGNAVCGVGDINGDSVPDLVVGGIDETTPAGPKSGRVFVLSGKSTGLLFDVQHFHTGMTSSFRLAGLQPSSVATFALSLTGNAPLATPFGFASMTPPIIVLAMVPSSPLGEATLLLPIPGGVAGTIVYAQAAEFTAAGGGQLSHPQTLKIH